MQKTARKPGPSPQEAEVLRLFDDWNEALKSRDPARVAALYAPDAVLLPTMSNEVRHDAAGITDYFRHFLAKAPEGRIEQSHIRLMGDVAIHSGIYVFNLQGDNGREDVPARFSFVYERLGQGWRIVEHHSSAMPEATA